MKKILSYLDGRWPAIFLAIILVIFIGTSILSARANAETPSGFIGITNNYVARGTAQNYDGDPSIIFNANYDFDNGAYVGVFNANVDFQEDKFGLQRSPTDLELSGWVGYRHKLGPVFLDGMLGSYNYAGDTFVSLDMTEAKVAATLPVGPVSLTSSVGWTPDYFNILGPSYWTDATVSFQASPKLNLSTGIGRQWIDQQGNGQAIPFNSEGYSYTTWNAGGTYSITEKISVEARYYDTDRHDLGEVYTANPYGQNVSVTFRRSF